MKQKELRIEIRARNNVLYHAIYDVFESVAEFCRITKLCPSTIGNLLNLKIHPWKKIQRYNRHQVIWKFSVGEYKDSCFKLAEVLGFSPEELFPSRLYFAAFRGAISGIIELDIKEIPFSALPELPASIENQPDKFYEKIDLQKSVQRKLNYLSSIEARVLSMRFGLGDLPEYTLREIADTIDMPILRIKQIIQEALRKLRRPNGTKYLKSFCD